MSDNAREGTNVEVFDTEIVEKLNPIQVTGVMQFVIPTPDKAMYMIHKSLVGMQKTIESSYAETTRLLNILNISMYEYENRKSVISDTDVTELLSELSLKMDAIAGVFASLPEWIPAHTLQESTGDLVLMPFENNYKIQRTLNPKLTTSR